MNNEKRDVRFDFVHNQTRSDGVNLWCSKPTESADHHTNLYGVILP